MFNRKKVKLLETENELLKSKLSLAERMQNSIRDNNDLLKSKIYNVSRDKMLMEIHLTEACNKIENLKDEIVSYQRMIAEYEEKIKSLKSYNGVQQVNLKITKEENEILQKENERLKTLATIQDNISDILIEHIINLEEGKQNEQTH